MTSTKLERVNTGITLPAGIIPHTSGANPLSTIPNGLIDALARDIGHKVLRKAHISIASSPNDPYFQSYDVRASIFVAPNKVTKDYITALGYEDVKHGESFTPAEVEEALHHYYPERYI